MRDELYRILAAPKELDRRIRIRAEKYQEILLTMIPGAIRYDQDRVQTSPEDKMLAAIAEADGEYRAMKKLERQKAKKIREITNLVIAALDDQIEREIILGRYCGLLKWEKVAEEQGITESVLFKARRSALDKLDIFISSGTQYLDKN